MSNGSAPTDNAPPETADAEQPRADATRPTKQQPTPYDELLCTICGLTACWQSPKNAQAASQK